MGYVKGLKCRECGREYPKGPANICEFCFGPLEVTYQYDEIRKVLSREVIASRPPEYVALCRTHAAGQRAYGRF